MSDKLQWYKFYATDWLSDATVRLMSSRQRGWYIDLLNWAWQEHGFHPSQAEIICQVSRDRELVDSLAGSSELNCAAMRDIDYELEAVISQFSVDCGGGKVSHQKLEQIRSESLQKTKQQSEAGRATQAKLRAKLSANQALRASDSGSVSVVSSKEGGVGETKLPAGYAMDEQYQDFRGAVREWGCNVIEEDFVAAWPAWRVLDGLQRAAAADGVKARTISGIAPDFAKSPKNYLQGREWKRPIKIPNGKRPRGLTTEELAAL